MKQEKWEKCNDKNACRKCSDEMVVNSGGAFFCAAEEAGMVNPYGTINPCVMDPHTECDGCKECQLPGDDDDGIPF